MFQKILSSGRRRNRSKSKDFWNDLQIVYTSPQVVAGETISKYNPFRFFGRNFQIIYKSLQVEGSEKVDFMQDLKKISLTLQPAKSVKQQRPLKWFTFFTSPLIRHLKRTRENSKTKKGICQIRPKQNCSGKQIWHIPFATTRFHSREDYVTLDCGGDDIYCVYHKMGAVNSMANLIHAVNKFVSYYCISPVIFVVPSSMFCQQLNTCI